MSRHYALTIIIERVELMENDKSVREVGAYPIRRFEESGRGI